MLSKISMKPRLLLLAGSSLVPGLLLASLTAVTLTPGSAWAADECGGVSPSMNGDAPDAVFCPASPPEYPDGISYVTEGAFSLTTGGFIDAGSAGLSVESGLAEDTIGVNTTAGAFVGPINVSSGSGAINLATGAVLGEIHALSDAGGSIHIQTDGQVGQISALSTGGDGSVTVTANDEVETSLFGIVTQSSGMGDTTIVVNDEIDIGFAPANGVAIDATTGEGQLRIDLNSAQVGAYLGASILADIGGDAILNVSESSALYSEGTEAWTVDIAGDDSSHVTINNEGKIGALFMGFNALGYDRLGVRVSGDAATVNSSGLLLGRLDFSGIAGGVTLEISGGRNEDPVSLSEIQAGWATSGLTVFSVGDDVLSTTTSGGIFTNGGEDGPTLATFDFGAGEDVFNNEGRLGTGANGTGGLGPSDLVLLNLETFNNSGSVQLGARFGGAGVGADDLPNDRLVAHGIVWNGLPGSQLVVDVDLFGGGQGDCQAAVAADCLDLSGGVATGLTLVKVYASNRQSALPAGHYNPEGLVIVDVNGGTSAAEHFDLDPTSDQYFDSPQLGPVIQTQGAFAYDLVYNADTQRHLLVGVPKPEMFELGAMAEQVQSIWRATAGTWFDRQADLRNTGEHPGGVWLRAGGDFVDRDLVRDLTLVTGTWSYDSTYDQRTFTLTGGVDHALSDETAVGFLVSYANSSVDFAASDTTFDYQGGGVGLYAAYESGAVYIDGMLSGAVLLLDDIAPGLTLDPGVQRTKTLQTLGGQLETGVRMPITSGIYVEPLASASYTWTQLNDFQLPGSTITFDDATSFQAGVGARLGVATSAAGFDLIYTVTARALQNLSDENQLVLDNDGPDFVISENLDDPLGDLRLGVSALSSSGSISGFVDGGLRLSDGYQATSISAGIRYRW